MCMRCNLVETHDEYMQAKYRDEHMWAFKCKKVDTQVR